MDYKQKEKEIEKWIKKNGAASFDIKEKIVTLYDGGLFAIEKEVIKEPRTRMIMSKKPNEDGMYPLKFVEVKGPLVKKEYYSATILFCEIDETIRYLQSMKRLLNKLGYSTNYNKK